MIRPLPFILAASDHGPMILNRLDFHQLPSGVAYGVGHQILINGAYDPKEIAHVRNILRNLVDYRGRGLIALDCGANIGVHTLEMAKALEENGRVVAVEAQERLFYALCGNIALSNLFNASAIFGAVGNEDGFLQIPKPDYNRPASFGSLELKRQEGTEYIGQSISYMGKDLTSISIFRIDSLRLPRLDFLKIDIEGMEIEALRGGENMIAQFHPTILIEWIKSDRKELTEFLNSAGYEIEEFGANLLATFVTE